MRLCVRVEEFISRYRADRESGLEELATWHFEGVFVGRRWSWSSSALSPPVRLGFAFRVAIWKVVPVLTWSKMNENI